MSGARLEVALARSSAVSPVGSGQTCLPKISATQISADRSGTSSRPISQSATMQFGSSTALHLISNRP